MKYSVIHEIIQVMIEGLQAADFLYLIFFFYRIRPYMWRISFLKSISLFIYPSIKIFNIRIWLMPFLKAWQAQNLQGRPPDCRYREELLFQVQRKSAG